MKIELDQIDTQIIEILTNEHRISYTEIASQLNLSRNTIHNKIKRLIQNDILINYTVMIDPNWLYLKTIFIEIKTNPHEPWLAEKLQKLSDCESIDGIIGEYSLIMKIRIKENFDKILNQIDSLMGKSSSKKYQIIDIIHTYKENGYKFEGEGKRRELDDKDWQLIEILRNQGRSPKSYSNISQNLKTRNVELSQPAVYKRIKRLETENIIHQFTIIPDYEKLGLNTKYYLRLKVNPASYNSTALDFLAKQPEIFDLYRTGENYGLLAVVRTPDINTYNQFLQNLYTDSRIIDTHTTLVLEQRKKY